jgi:hypothetical protein
VVAGIWFGQRQPEPAARAQTAIPVRVVSVAQQDVPRYASAIGSVLSLHSVEVGRKSRGYSPKCWSRKANG